MGLKEKILDGFQSLSEKISEGDLPLSHVDPQRLNAELEERAARREERPHRAPVDNPIARAVLPGPKGATLRRQQAAKRESRMRAQRRERQAAEKESQDDILRRMKAESAKSRTSWSHSTSSTESHRQSESRSRRPMPPLRMAEHYKTLGIDHGSDLGEIKRAYRGLMRKYHPDLHTGDVKKQRAATELSMKISLAYNALSDHLQGN